jgi:OOP family OmpA-OmpF porin
MRNSIRILNYNHRFAVAVAAWALASWSLAADESGMWYLNPQYGWTLLDKERPVNNDDQVGLGIGRHLSSSWSLEANGLWGKFTNDAGGKLQQSALSLDALAVFGRANRVSPYFTLGAGYIENKYDFDGEFGPFGQAGFGLLFDLGESHDGTFVFQLRPEVKYRFDWAEGRTKQEHGDVVFNLGFMLNVGDSRAPPVSHAPPPPPPPAPPPPPPPPPKPLDSDGDGVPDSADRCPDTPAGVAVDEKGCPVEPVILRGVEFETASATLTEGSLPVLKGVADDLKLHPLVHVELQGHTDSRGADDYNLELSQRRADSVRDYLIAQGVSGTRLVARGYGETQPIGANNTAAGRAQNRRVVMTVTANPNNAPIQGDAPR